MSTLSFAIPFHSGTRLLEAALQSVIRQTTSDWECVVCDDSPDGQAKEVVSRLEHPKIRYSRNPAPSGMVGNWMFCLNEASTEWVTLLHADDELGPRYAEALLDGIRRHPGASAYYCQGEIIDEEGTRIFSFPDWLKRRLDPSGAGEIRLAGEGGVVALLKGDFILCPAVAYRREIALELGFRREFRMAQDLDFYFRLLFSGREIQGLSATEYRYRRHGKNASAGHTRDRSRFREEFQVYDEVLAQTVALDWKKAAALARRRTILRLHLGYLMLGDLWSGQWSSVAKDLVGVVAPRRLQA